MPAETPVTKVFTWSTLCRGISRTGQLVVIHGFQLRLRSYEVRVRPPYDNLKPRPQLELTQPGGARHSPMIVVRPRWDEDAHHVYIAADLHVLDTATNVYECTQESAPVIGMPETMSPAAALRIIMCGIPVHMLKEVAKVPVEPQVEKEEEDLSWDAICKCVSTTPRQLTLHGTQLWIKRTNPHPLLPHSNYGITVYASKDAKARRALFRIDVQRSTFACTVIKPGAAPGRRATVLSRNDINIVDLAASGFKATRKNALLVLLGLLTPMMIHQLKTCNGD